MRILKIPFNGGALGKKDGQELGPNKVVEFLKNFHISETEKLPVFAEEEILVDNMNLEDTFSLIESQVSKIDTVTTIIGGDHSITHPCFKAFSKRFSNPGIIVFDAHPDVQDDFTVTHENYLRRLVSDGFLKKENIILIGIRNWSKEEVMYLKQNRIKYYSMKEITFDDIKEICDSIMSVAREWDGLYLSIDIDVLDPAFAPGTGHTEPGGMSSRELIYFMQRLKLLKNLKMIDLVEVNPKKDIDDLTSKIAAKLIIELC
mgnify:CR=1 FL=1|jgi:formiminoglutamase